MGVQKLQIVGKTFGRLTVVQRGGKTSGHDYYWICQCICGNTTKATHANLKHGGVKSCGCLFKDTGARRKYKRRLSPGVASASMVLLKYKGWARKRNLSWNLSNEDFYKLTAGNCFYCGVSPQRIHKISSNGEFIYNGIDRVDNTIGYRIDNCVPCCTTCNKMKLEMTVPEFKNHMTKILSHLESCLT